MDGDRKGTEMTYSQASGIKMEDLINEYLTTDANVKYKKYIIPDSTLYVPYKHKDPFSGWNSLSYQGAQSFTKEHWRF